MIFESGNNEDQPLLVGGENQLDIDNQYIIGGIQVHFQKEFVDEPTKRFENLVVPIGLYNIKINDTNDHEVMEDDNAEEHSFMDEKQFSKLFYSISKDLGSSKTKPKMSITKKNR